MLPGAYKSKECGRESTSLYFWNKWREVGLAFFIWTLSIRQMGVLLNVNRFRKLLEEPGGKASFTISQKFP